MKTIPVWHGSLVGVGREIEIKVLIDRRGRVKLNIAAPEGMRIARKSAPPPRRRLVNRVRPRT